MKLTVYPKGTTPRPKRTQKQTPAVQLPTDLDGKMVLFKNDAGLLVPAQVVKHLTQQHVEVRLAIPNHLGLLIVSKSAVVVDVDDVTEVDAAHVKGDVREWRTERPVENVKAMEVKDGDVVVDVKDVTFAGYGSTFEDVTPADRDGDAVDPGAFNRSLELFKRNPVMLIDHTRSVDKLAGSYTDVSVDQKGLRVIGKMSNAPELRRVRYLVHEGHLKTLSMGGFFYWTDPEAPMKITEVDLHEISLVVVPANFDAEFTSRSLDADDAGKAFVKHAKRFGGEVRCKA